MGVVDRLVGHLVPVNEWSDEEEGDEGVAGKKQRNQQNAQAVASGMAQIMAARTKAHLDQQQQQQKPVVTSARVEDAPADAGMICVLAAVGGATVSASEPSVPAVVASPAAAKRAPAANAAVTKKRALQDISNTRQDATANGEEQDKEQLALLPKPAQRQRREKAVKPCAAAQDAAAASQHEQVRPQWNVRMGVTGKCRCSRLHQNMLSDCQQRLKPKRSI